MGLCSRTIDDFKIAEEIDRDCLAQRICNRVDMPVEQRARYDEAVGFPCDPLVGSLVVALGMRDGVQTVNSCNGVHLKQRTSQMTPSPVVEFVCDCEPGRRAVLCIVGREHFGMHGRDGLNTGEIGGSAKPMEIEIADGAGGHVRRKTVIRSVYGGKSGSALDRLRKIAHFARALVPEG